MPDGGTSTVSVIVPVHDDVDGLRRCLAAIAAQHRPADEVVVVDSASSPPLSLPDTAPTATRLVRVAEAGSYHARNAGVAASSGRVVAFTDADCVPTADWLARGLDALARADRVAGRVEVVARDDRRPTSVELFELMFAFPQDWYVREKGFGVTANLLVRREVLDDVGPFDGALASAGDAEWGRRVTAAGWSIVHAPDVIVRHDARRTWRQLITKRRRTMRGNLDLHATGRLEWDPGVRMFLLPDRATLHRVRHEGAFSPTARLRIALVVLVEGWVAASVVLADRWRRRRAAA